MTQSGFSGKAFRDWSWPRYDRAGVAELCLQLQDRHGFNVNLLLLAAWLELEHGLALSAKDCDWLQAALSDETALVEAQRRLRRQFRKLEAADAPYRVLLDAELALEGWWQGRAVDKLTSRALARLPESAPAGHNLACYREARGEAGDGEVAERIRRLWALLKAPQV